MTDLLTRRAGHQTGPPRPHHRHAVPVGRDPGPAVDVVLASHGSRDPRAAVATGRLGEVVAALRPGWRVRAAYLDFTAPSLAEALTDGATVVPLLLTPAYHARVDIPGVIAASGATVRLTSVLGPERGAPAPALVEALVGRLREAVARPGAVVLGAAGSREPAALASVESVAAALAGRLGVPVIPGYASGAGRPVADALAAARRLAAGNVAVSSYFLAPGVLWDRIVTASAGLGPVAAPLGDAAQLAQLVIRRVEQRVIAR